MAEDRERADDRIERLARRWRTGKRRLRRLVGEREGREQSDTCRRDGLLVVDLRELPLRGQRPRGLDMRVRIARAKLLER